MVVDDLASQVLVLEYPSARAQSAGRWRMSLVDYESALLGSAADPMTETEPLKGAPVVTMKACAGRGDDRARGRAVMEERLLGVLVGDLGRQPSPLPGEHVRR